MSDTKSKYYDSIFFDRDMMFSHSSFFLEKKEMEAIKSGNLKYALEILEEINSRPHAKLAKGELRSIKNSIMCSCALFARASIEAGADYNRAFSYSDAFIQRIEELTTTEEVLDIEKEILEHYTSESKKALLQKYSYGVFRVVRYVNANLSSRLTVKDIAKAVRLSPNYVSALFKREMSISLTEYINRQKINEASNFIINTDRPVSDIAQLYGFCNQSYFISVFKQYFGKTPNEVRNNK